MESLAENYKHIPGWGSDADPENEPTYPMKHWTGDDHRRLNYQRPPLQPLNVEILHSNERPNVSAVFGTPNPPSGLSGQFRRLAFRYSEGNWWHWLALLAADRVNVIEGIAEDLREGHVPNMIKERGLMAEWKYNRKGVIEKALVAGVLVTALVLWKGGKKKAKKVKGKR